METIGKPYFTLKPRILMREEAAHETNPSMSNYAA